MKRTSRYTVDIDKFEAWIYSRFDYVRRRGQDYVVYNPLFHHHKPKLYISPWKNAYHDWVAAASNAHSAAVSGPIHKLIMAMEDCPLDKAKEMIYENPNAVSRFDGAIKSLQDNISGTNDVTKKDSTLPSLDFVIPLTEDSTKYLEGRGIDGLRWGMFTWPKGHRNPVERILMPFRDIEGNLIYWKARAIKKGSWPLYVNPDDDEFGYGKEDVVYCPDWSIFGPTFLVEGELDAVVLASCGIRAFALGGKDISTKQLLKLKNEKNGIVVSFDNDTEQYGQKAAQVVIKAMMDAGITDLMRCDLDFNSDEIKDWNDLLLATGSDFVSDYATHMTKKIDFKMTVLEALDGPSSQSRASKGRRKGGFSRK